MTKQPSLEELSRYQEWIRQQRELDRERGRIGRLVLATDKHDRRTCGCDGCMYWWMINTVLTEQGQFMEVLPNIKVLIKEKGLPLYMRDYILQLRLRDALNRQPLWIAYNRATNRNWVKSEI